MSYAAQWHRVAHGECQRLTARMTSSTLRRGGFAQAAKVAEVKIAYHEERGWIHAYVLTPTPEGRAARAAIVAAAR